MLPSQGRGRGFESRLSLYILYIINMQEISAYDLRKNRDNYTILDIREQSERLKDGTIPENYHLSLSTITIDDIKKFLDNNKVKDIVIYCHTGKRSSMLIKTIIDNKIIDPRRIYNLEGGYVLWKLSGGEINII